MTQDEAFQKTIRQWIKGQELLLEELDLISRQLQADIILKQKRLKHNKDERIHERQVLSEAKASFENRKELNLN